MFENLSRVIDQVGKDKGIAREVLIETVEAAIKTAAKRTFGDQRDIEAQFNEETGEVEIFQVNIVVDSVDNHYCEVALDDVKSLGFQAEEGDELLFQIFYLPSDHERATDQDKKFGHILQLESARATFGRIAAQTAKQVIVQRIREAEREMIYNDYKDRQGELITGIVRRFEKGNIIVDLGRADAILPTSEQTPRESYRAADRIQGWVKEVRRSSREPQIVLSRAAPGLVISLFEQEVPEIHEGIVKIVAVAREAGTRSKVGVHSSDRDVDPVGACVGMRGSRVQAVVQELRGEKIDIVPFNEDPARFVCSAISPAEVSRVLVDEGNMSMELIVPDDQLSLAIGRGGQNVRLAAQLTGWDLDIISQGRLKAVMEEARQSLLEYEGITEDMIGTLFSLGYTKLEDIADAEIAEIAQIPGFGEERASIAIAVSKEINSRSIEEELQGTEQFAEITAMTVVAEIHTETATSLYRGGYSELELVYFEEDPERMDTRTGLGLKNCKMLIQAVQEHLGSMEGFDADKMEGKRESISLLLDVLKPIPPIRRQGRRVGEPGSGEIVEVEKAEEPAAEAAPEAPTEEPAAEAAPEAPTEEPAAEAAPEAPTEEPAAEAAPEAPTEEPAAEAAPEAPSEEPAAEAAPEGDSDEKAATEEEAADSAASAGSDDASEDEATEKKESSDE